LDNDEVGGRVLLVVPYRRCRAAHVHADVRFGEPAVARRHLQYVRRCRLLAERLDGNARDRSRPDMKRHLLDRAGRRQLPVAAVVSGEGIGLFAHVLPRLVGGLDLDALVLTLLGRCQPTLAIPVEHHSATLFGGADPWCAVPEDLPGWRSGRRGCAAARRRSSDRAIASDPRRDWWS